MREIFEQVLVAIILISMAAGVVALMALTTSRLKWIVAGFLFCAAHTYVHVRYLSTAIGMLVMLAVYAWDERLRARKVDVAIEQGLLEDIRKPRDEKTRAEFERVSFMLR